MTDSNDELIEQLASANPIDSHGLPSGTDYAPQQLLENIMSRKTSSEVDSESDTGSQTQEPVELLELPSVRGIDRYGRGGRNRMRALATVAAVLLLVVGFVVFSPDNTAPALATVHSAAQTTADFDSGRVNTTFILNGTDGEQAETVGGEVLAEFSGTDIQITGNLDDSTGETAGMLPSDGQARLVDGVLYVSEGEEWYAVETGGLIGQTVVDFVDPRSVLAEVEDLVDTTEIGTAVIDGVDTTQYRSIVDVNDESLQETGWLPVEAATGLEAEGQVTVDLYIDGDGVLRQLGVSGDLVETGGPGTATFTITTNFFDLGADVAIEAPAESTLIDPEADFNFGDQELDLTD